LVKERFGCKLIQFSVISNHMHFMIETARTADLSRYMQGLQIRLAKGLNRLWLRRGRVFADRFFARLCETAGQIRRATRYVINNARRHGIPIPMGCADPYSSGPYYVHWMGRLGNPGPGAPIFIPSGADVDYHHYPLLSIDAVPGWSFRPG
jgi:hypothetical protein